MAQALTDLSLASRSSSQDMDTVERLYERIVAASPRQGQGTRPPSATGRKGARRGRGGTLRSSAPVVLDYAAFTHWALPLDHRTYVHACMAPLVGGCLVMWNGAFGMCAVALFLIFFFSRCVFGWPAFLP